MKRRGPQQATRRGSRARENFCPPCVHFPQLFSPRICTSSADICSAPQCRQNFPEDLEAITTQASSFSAAAVCGGSCLLSRADVYLTRHSDFFITFSLLRFLTSTLPQFHGSTLLHFHDSTVPQFQLCLVHTADPLSDIKSILATRKAAAR